MKVLIFGLGSIGKKHIAAIKEVKPSADIFAFRFEKDAEIYLDVKNIYSYEEITIIKPDFAIIANPTSEHKQTIEKLSKFNFPLFIEKPVYYKLNIEKLITKIASKGTQTYVACNLRFLDCIKFIKENLHQNPIKRLNEVNVYCGSYLPDWRPNTDFRENYSAIQELGGGVHLDLIHELDYIYWLFGIPKEVKRNFRSKSCLEISSYDYANYILDYEGFCANVVLNYYRRDSKRSLELVFEDETWNVDLLKNQISYNQQVVFSSEQEISDTYKAQMEYFIDNLEEKTNNFNTISDAYNVLKICIDK